MPVGPGCPWHYLPRPLRRRELRRKGAGSSKWQLKGNGVLGRGKATPGARRTRESEIATASVQGKEGAKCGRERAARSTEDQLERGGRSPAG